MALPGGCQGGGPRPAASPIRRGQTHSEPPGAPEDLSSLHREIDPSRWSVTRADLEVFEWEVRKLWKAGAIPDDLQQPNEFHDHPDFGPTIYQVNEHYIKPKTREAGGMSWALMRHPEGLECDVFVSHCWAEGVFEFCRKVRRMWPWGARHLWCCFLANPQNCDISALLGLDPLGSPFARALRRARYFLVVPNQRVSIYRRLWCVFEMHLAMEMQLQVLLPATPQRRHAVAECAPLALVGLSTAAGSYLLGGALHFRRHVRPGLRSPEICAMYIAPAVMLISRPLARVAPRAYLVAVAVLLGIRAGLKVLLRDQLPLELQLVVGVPQWCVTGAVLEYAVHMLAGRCLQHEGNQLAFGSVRQGSCSNAEDERAIREAIRGHEDAIDEAIVQLRRVGRYDAAVLANLARGMSPARAREGVLAFGTGAGACYWVEAVAMAVGARLARGGAVNWGSLGLRWTLGMYAVAWVLAFGGTRYLGDRCIYADDAVLSGAVLAVLSMMFADHVVPASWSSYGLFRRSAAPVLCVAVGAHVVVRCLRFYARCPDASAAGPPARQRRESSSDLGSEADSGNGSSTSDEEEGGGRKGP